MDRYRGHTDAHGLRRLTVPKHQALGTAFLSLLCAVVPPVRAQDGPAPMMHHAPYWSRALNLIVFESDRDGDSEVYVMDPDDGSVRQLTHHRTFHGAARWTHDGRRILFRSDRDGAVQTYQMEPDGSEPRPAPDVADSVEALSPDGETLLVVSRRGGYSVVLAVDSRGGPGRQLTGGSDATQPSFSPDGSRIVYEENMAGIVVMRRDGSNPRKIAEGTDPSWSPDGALILFKVPTDRPGGFGWEIATIRPDGSSLARLRPGVHPSWSPDGSRIVFMAETGPERSDLWLINRDGTRPRCLTCSHRRTLPEP